MNSPLSIRFIYFLFVSLFFILVGCSDKDKNAGGTSEAENSIADKTVAGVSQKGPFVNGSTVTLHEVDGENLVQTGKTFTGKVASDKGEFKISNINLEAPYALLEADGFYWNEVTGRRSASQIKLNALTDLEDRETANINLLTHLAYERAQWLVRNKSMSVADAKAQAEREIFAAFGVEDVPQKFEDLNIFNNGEGDAALLAISVMMQLQSTEAVFSERLADFATDLESDGVWDNDKLKAEIADNSFEADAGTIRKNIEAWDFSDIVPEFESVMEAFWNDTYGLGRCTDKREGAMLPDTNEYSAYYRSIFRCLDNHWILEQKHIDGDTVVFPIVELDTIEELDCTGSMYCAKNCMNVMDPDLGKTCSRVNTELDDGSDTYGLFFTYSDSASRFSWPAGDRGYGHEAASRDKYGFIYTIVTLGESHPYARIAFEVSGEEQQGNDLTEWGGVCITYTANESFFINIRFPDDNKATEYDYYKAQLPASELLVTANIKWSDFIQEGFGIRVDRDSVVTNISRIEISFEKPGARISSKIHSISKYGTCD